MEDANMERFFWLLPLFETGKELEDKFTAPTLGWLSSRCFNILVARVNINIKIWCIWWIPVVITFSGSMLRGWRCVQYQNPPRFNPFRTCTSRFLFLKITTTSIDHSSITADQSVLTSWRCNLLRSNSALRSDCESADWSGPLEPIPGSETR